MTQDELLDLISRFSQRPLPALGGRHVYLWHGSWEGLKGAIPTQVVAHLDLHRLAATLERAPRARDEASRLLRRAVQKELNERLTSDSQQILVVTGCDLLSRYQVSINPFFQVASEKHMVILIVSPAETYFQPSEPLPDYVTLDASAPFDYLQAAVGPEATVNVTEDVL
jgi:hypothetical protein